MNDRPDVTWMGRNIRDLTHEELQAAFVGLSERYFATLERKDVMPPTASATEGERPDGFTSELGSLFAAFRWAPSTDKALQYQRELMASIRAAARAEMREACAKVVERLAVEANDIAEHHKRQGRFDDAVSARRRAGALSEASAAILALS